MIKKKISVWLISGFASVLGLICVIEPADVLAQGREQARHDGSVSGSRTTINSERMVWNRIVKPDSVKLSTSQNRSSEQDASRTQYRVAANSNSQPASFESSQASPVADHNEPVVWNEYDRACVGCDGCSCSSCCESRPHDHGAQNSLTGCSCARCCSSAPDYPDTISLDFCLPSQIWARAEYALWSIEGMDLPALVTSSPLGTPAANTGLLAQSGTETLFGGNGVNESHRSGGGFSIGWWTDHSQTSGFEFDFLGIGRDGDRFGASSDSTPLLARPFIDTGLGTEASMLIAHPDFLAGSVTVDARNEMQSYEFSHRTCLSRNSCERWDLLVGYRHARMDEAVQVDQTSTYTQAQGPIVAGTNIALFDRFEAQNQFNGAQFGFSYQNRTGYWTIEALAKVGFGVNRGKVSVSGQTTNSVPGAADSTFTGGLLAQETNIGNFSQSDFAVIPEARITLATDLTPRTQLSLGYGLLFWSSVARAADHIDRRVSQLPPEPVTGDARPRFQFTTDGMVAHGMRLGLKYEF